MTTALETDVTEIPPTTTLTLIWSPGARFPGEPRYINQADYVAATSQQHSTKRGEFNVVLVIALEIRDLVNTAWKAYRATQTRRRPVSGSRPALGKTLAPTA